MKKKHLTNAKKTLSVFLAVLMLMTAWVWVAPEKAEAAALEAASSLYNKSLLNGINTNVDYSVNTEGNYYKFKIYGNGDDGNANTLDRRKTYYKNLLSHDGDSSLVGDNNRGSYFTNVTNSELTVSIVYPTMVLKYDGVTTPRFGIMLEGDSSSGKKIRFERAWMDANSNGLSFNPNYWLGIAKDDSAFFYIMEEAKTNYLNAQDTSNGKVFNARSNGQWEFLASTLEFTGSMSIGEWTRAISPTWKFYNGSTTYTGTNTSTIYVMNFKGYGELLTRINNHKADLLNNAGQYTTDSIKTYVEAAKAITNLNPKNYTGVNSAASWGSQMNTAYANYNTAIDNLKKREYEITYDNMFSLADWRYSQSYEKSGVSVDLSAGKVTVKHPNSSGEYVTTHSGSSSNANSRNTNYYAMPVVGGQEYTFKYTTDGANTEMFAFFYDKNGGCAHESSFGAYCFTVNSGTGQKTFKAPDTATCVEIRFDNNTPSSTANYWDIMIYPASLKNDLEIDSWTARPHRQLYNYGASVGTLQTPARPGYIFSGWKEDTDGDGIGDAAVSGTLTKSRVLYSTWTPGTMDVGYDNLFSLSAWANSNSSVASNTSRGSIAYDLDAGTITAITTKDGEVYSNYGSSSGHYQMAVEPNTEYIFTADVDLEGSGNQGQMFVFFYDASGSGATGSIYNGAAQSSPHIGIYITKEGENSIAFTTPSNCTKMSIRVGATVAPTTATYSNIGFYKKSSYDNYAKNYEKVREPFIIGETKNLMNPTRDGYDFDGWTLADGTKVTSTDGFNANTVVYANWTKLWTVTYYYGDNTTPLATKTVRNGETVDSLPTVVPTKDTTDEYTYEFDYWYANGTKFTKDTVITSDLSVFPEFKNIAHSDFVFSLKYASTCTANATVTKKCGNCGYSFGDVTYDPAEDANAASHTSWLAKGHDFSNENDILANSSTGNGETDTHSIKCARYDKCGQVKAVSHIWAGSDPEGATCTTPGTINWSCPCGAEKTTYGDVAPDAHNYDETKGTSNGDSKTHTVACTYNAAHTKTVACTDTDGNCACDICGQELIHVYDQKTETYLESAADCVNDAVYYYTCKCGKQGTETWIKENSKLDHTYTNYVYNNDAKCGVDGTKTAECDTCDTGATHTITAEGTARTHEFTGAIKDNENGTHSYKCKYDDCDVYGGTVDCTYGEWDTTGEAQHVKTCTACSYKLEGDHDFSDWATTDKDKEADGQHSKTCSVCAKVVTEDCTYTRTPYAETCTTDGYTVHSCDECDHEYRTTDIGKTGHDYTGAVKSYSNGQHNFLCVNGCNTYGYAGSENARTTCTYEYKNNSDGKHQATCTACNYSFAEECSGGQASCTTLKVCDKCNTGYGTTDPHSFTGTVVELEGDVHAYLCEYCSTAGLYGVGADKDATEACFGGTATCTALAVCEKCSDTYGDLASHTFNGDAVVLEGDVHAYRCSACKDDTLYGVGTENDATEACSGGTATCTDLAVCDICKDTHGELDADAHKWGDWANVENTETHKRVCEYNNEHIQTATCESSGKAIVDADCEAEGYDLNTCDFCNHQWKTNYTPALGHDWDVWVSNNAGGTIGGTHTRTCKRVGCHYADDHTAKTETAACADAEPVVTAPTCTEKGYTTYTCDACDHVWVADYTDATGHTFTERRIGAAYEKDKQDCVTAETYWFCCKDCDASAEHATDAEADKVGNVLFWVNKEALGHNFSAKNTDQKYEKTPADCTNAAVYYYSCSRCGEKGTETFVSGTALGHAWTETEKYLASEADCITDAVYYKECSRCEISSENETGETWTKENSKTGHEYAHVEGKAATCTEDGVVEHYTCDVCHKYFSADKSKEYTQYDIVIIAGGHDYEEIPAKAATCEENGYTKHKECKACHDRNKEYKVIYATGHSFDAKNGYVELNGYHAYNCAACDAYGVGNVKYSVVDGVVSGAVECTFEGEYTNGIDENGKHYHERLCVCGASEKELCAAVKTATTAPTCTEAGYDTYTCQICGNAWTVTTGDALEHNLVIRANNNGTHSKACQREGCDYEEIAERCSTDKPATDCGTRDVCDVCKTAFGDVKPHVFKDYVSDNNATCTEDGTKTAVCSTCKGEEKAKDVIVDKGTKLGHDMSESVFAVTKDEWKFKPADFDDASIYKPTCAAEGRALSYCSRCDEYRIKTVSKDAGNHVWDTVNGKENWVEVSGNCLTGVTLKLSCTVCSVSKTKTETREHDFVIIFESAPTCEKEGYRKQECSTCGYIADEYYIEGESDLKPLGHNVPEWTEADVTCQEVKYRYGTCTTCGNMIIEPDEDGTKGDHNFKTVAEVKATCDAPGNNEYQLCKVCGFEEGKVVTTVPHKDKDGNDKCDECNRKLYTEGDTEKSCGCICHKESGFMKFIYKIINFFWKLFKISKSCDCGTVHWQ